MGLKCSLPIHNALAATKRLIKYQNGKQSVKDSIRRKKKKEKKRQEVEKLKIPVILHCTTCCPV
jgi:hypothetical protein